jgi:hypothetical protein
LLISGQSCTGAPSQNSDACAGQHTIVHSGSRSGLYSARLLTANPLRAHIGCGYKLILAITMVGEPCIPFIDLLLDENNFLMTDAATYVRDDSLSDARRFNYWRQASAPLAILDRGRSMSGLLTRDATAQVD